MEIESLDQHAPSSDFLPPKISSSIFSEDVMEGFPNDLSQNPKNEFQDSTIEISNINFTEKFYAFDENKENTIKQLHFEPLWYTFFLGNKENSELLALDSLTKTLQNGYAYMIQGLFFEYGVLRERDLGKALVHYKEGARKKECMCNYRLFFIYKDHHKEFGVENNHDFALLHLVLAAVYFEYSYFMIFEGTRGLNPLLTFLIYLQNYDLDRVKWRVFIKFLQGINEKLDDYFKFVEYWISYKYSMVDFQRIEAFENLMIHSNEKDVIEAKIGAINIYYKEMETFRPEYAENVEKLVKYLEQSQDSIGILGLTFSRYKKKHDLKHYISTLKKLFRNGYFHHSACYLGNAYIIGLSLDENVKVGLKLFYIGMLFNDISAYVDLFRYLWLKNLQFVFDKDRINKKMIYLTEIKDYFTGSIFRCDYLVFFLNKLEEFKRNPARIIEYLTKNYDESCRYMNYKMGIIYERQQNTVLSEKHFKIAFNLYSGSLGNSKGYSVFHYRIAKMYEKGRGVPQDLQKALSFYKEGAEAIKNLDDASYQIFKKIYSEKCRAKFGELEKTLGEKANVNHVKI